MYNSLSSVVVGYVIIWSVIQVKLVDLLKIIGLAATIIINISNIYG